MFLLWNEAQIDYGALRCWMRQSLREWHSCWTDLNLNTPPATYYFCCVSVSVWAAIITQYGWGASGTDIYFSQFQSRGGPRSGYQHSWVLVRALLLVCRWPPSCCVLTWRRAGSPVFFSFYKNTNPIRRVLPLWPHITRITSWGPASKYSLTGD